MTVIIEAHTVLIDRSDYKRILPLSRWRIHHQRSHSYVERRGQHLLRLSTFLLGKPPRGFLIDHRNGNGLDNRRSNLRVCTPLHNSWNRRRIPNASGFKGVTKARRAGWRARIGYKWNLHPLGHYRNEVAAARAYDSAAIFLFGEFARTNFPNAQPVSPLELNRRARALAARTRQRRSGGVGLMWNGHWRAYTTRAGKHIHLGSFTTKRAARQAYLAAIAL